MVLYHFYVLDANINKYTTEKRKIEKEIFVNTVKAWSVFINRNMAALIKVKRNGKYVYLD